MGIAKWLVALVVALSVVTQIAQSQYYECSGGICSVFQCSNSHLSKYGYQLVFGTSCCNAAEGNQLDRNCCTYPEVEGSSNSFCLCWPQSTCILSEIAPSTSKPTTIKPSTPKPTIPMPTTQEPTTPEPTTPEPTTPEPTTSEPTTPEPTTPEPTTPEPTTPKPTTPEPTTPKPTTPKPTTSQPATTDILFSLCSSDLSNFRILNGRPVQNQCAYKGIANITVPTGSGDQRSVRCHAVYTTVTIDKKLEDAFVTTKICSQLINFARQNNIRTALAIGAKQYPLSPDLFEFIPGPNGLYFLKPVPLFKSLLDNFGDCQTKVCAYNPNSIIMPLVTELTNCKVVSYGAMNPHTMAQDGLNEADVELAFGQCDDLVGDEMCFVAKSNLRTICNSDYAAPVYCTAPINNERLFVGNVLNKDCNSDNPAFKIIGYPG